MSNTSDFWKKAVVYQISLRSFTREGTFRAAEAMLPHVREAGVDVVYLTPFVAMDTDMDRSGWSPRQIQSGFETPKNPYRIMDYTRVDSEYGTDADAKSFTDRAHGLGMKVIFDLVYLHCGPNNVIRKAVPNAFQLNPDGSVRTTQWNFPYLNFDSPATREYLYANMTHFAKDIGCDGFRCDVGDQVPLDFWEEGFRRMREIKPGFIAINEGCRPDYLTVFDANYGWTWSFSLRDVFKGELKLPDMITAQSEYEAKCPAPPVDLIFMENHDISTDDWEKRFDRVHPVEFGNAFFAATFLFRGIPVVYNGNEIADNALMSFFGPVEDPRRAFKTVDWARALQPEGRKRLGLLRKLSGIRHSVPAFSSGSMEFAGTSAPERILAFVRTAPDGSKFLVAVNTTDAEVKFTADFEPAGEPVLCENVSIGSVWTAGPYGFAAVPVK